MRSSIKVYIFITALFLVVVLMFSAISIFPEGLIAKVADIFENDSINFIFLMTICILLSLLISEPVARIYQKLKKRRQEPLRLGQILISEDLIDEIQLSDALHEQKLRIGEILAEAGRITLKQLNRALDLQKKSPEKIGRILRQIGYATDADIHWALGQAKRKLGEILMEKGLISFAQLQYALSIQRQNIV